MAAFFFDQSGRLRTAWRFVIFGFGFLIVQLGLGLMLGIGIVVFLLATGKSLNSLNISPQSIEEYAVPLQMIAALPMTLASFGLVWLCRRYLDRRSLGSLGLVRPGRAPTESVAGGLALGTLPVVLAIVILLATGGLAWEGVSASLQTALLVPTFVVMAFTEEIVCRGYLLQNLIDIGRPRFGIWFSSAIFWLLHALNPAAWSSPIVAINLFGAGVTLALAYRVSRNIWFPTAAHFGWNFAQGVLFQVPVSGIKTDGLFDVQVVASAPTWLTGGQFGIEGSILATVAELGMSLVLLRILLRRTPEILIAETAPPTSPPEIGIAVENEPTRPSLSSLGRLLVLVTAFLGWMCAGIHMSITSVAMRPAVTGLLHETGSLDLARFQTLAKQDKAAVQAPQLQLISADKRQLDEWKTLVAKWFAWCQCAFLFGAAAGGLCFGALGDRIGRSKGMAFSILTYSAMAAAAYYARQPEELLVLWFLACMGVGGMWPNGVALVSEAWSSLSRPVAAGLIGTSANIGIFLMATTMTSTNPDLAVIPGHWRWVMLVAAAPLLLGIFSLIFVPESPRWLALKSASSAGLPSRTAHSEIFRPPLLGITLVGIALATIPLFGGWGSANWMVPWADEAGESASPPNPQLKAQVSQARSVTGIVGSLLGGWIASVVGRRLTYLLTSVCALAVAQFTFWFVVPTDRYFLVCVSALGFFSGIYFGWLPLCLPELFPTRNRSTGAGVSFNFGRILTAVTVFATSTVMAYFAGDYARLGRVTSLIFALGIVFIGFAPDTSRKQLQD